MCYGNVKMSQKSAGNFVYRRFFYARLTGREIGMRRRRRYYRRRLYIRESLTGYGRDVAQEIIPYREDYVQFMLTERGFASKTVQKNLNMLRQFSRFLQREYDLSFEPINVTPMHIRRFLAYLKNEREISASTRNSYLAALGSYYFFLECYEYIEIEDNPTSLIRRARVPRRLPVCLSLEEAQSLLNAAAAGKNPERDVAMLRVMLQTGLRVGEMLALRTFDINFEERTLFIRGKDNRERLVPLTDNTCSALRDYLAVRKPSLPQMSALFLDKWGNVLDGNMANEIFQPLCYHAGINKPGLTLRNLRHTCLTLLLHADANLLAIKKLAGHSTVKSTQRYLHVTQKRLREAMTKHPLQ